MPQQFIPNSINHKFTELVRLYAAVWVPKFELKKPVLFFGVSQSRGRSYWFNAKDSANVITIPDWLLKRKDAESYIQEYIIHELCHQKDHEQRGRSDHGPEFYQLFKRYCPQEWWHYEESYKPREFKRAAMGMLDLWNDKGEPDL